MHSLFCFLRRKGKWLSACGEGLQKNGIQKCLQVGPGARRVWQVSSPSLSQALLPTPPGFQIDVAMNLAAPCISLGLEGIHSSDDDGLSGSWP